MVSGLETIAGFIALILTGILADAIRPNGKLNHAIKTRLEKRRIANGAHKAIPDVVDKLDRINDKQDKTYRKVSEIENKTDRNMYLIQEFHGDESIDIDVTDVLDDDNDLFSD